MSATYIVLALRRAVVQRARDCCEYCLLHADDAYHSHHVDHIIAEKHGGSTDAANLALCCADCNLRKGSDIASLTASGQLMALFHPRLYQWNEHFRVADGAIEPLTPTGEVTVNLLALNEETRVEIRRTLTQLQLWPRS